MQFEMRHGQVHYDGFFLKPAFELSLSLPAVVRDMHLELSKSFQVRLSEISGLPGSTLADLGIRIANEIGELELHLDRMSFRSSAITQPEQLLRAKRWLFAAHEALKQALPTVAIGASTFRISSWLKCDGEPGSAQRLLEETSLPAHPFNPATIGASSISYSLRADIASPERGWRATLVIDRSLVPDFDLFALLDLAFLDGLAAGDPAGRIARTEEIYMILLREFGLTPRGA